MLMKSGSLAERLRRRHSCIRAGRQRFIAGCDVSSLFSFMPISPWMAQWRCR